MADAVDLAQQELTAADKAWTAARSKIYPTNKIARRLNALKSDGANNPNSPDYSVYLQYQREYDAAVAEEAAAKEAYLTAQDNYKKVYNQENTPSETLSSTPATSPATPAQSQTTIPETQNPSAEEATVEASGPQAENFAPQYADFDQPVAEPDFNEPLQEPPGTQDEFSGIDAQVEANENALQEPPQLSDEEVNTYFDNIQNEQIENENTTVDDGSDPYVSNGESTISESSFSPNPGSTQGSAVRGLTAAAQSKATKDDAVSFQKKPDWRVRLSLSPGANYLYKVGDGQAGILNPLQKTDGVIFPYTPAVSVTYTAGYDSADIVHSNYKVFQYKGSSVDNVQITGDFTAQDTNEANYLLAVIHFFRSVTKMFYGQDQNPKNGVPPPLLYLTGLGTYQYDAHPLAITNFTYSLPTDVDYIRAGSQTNQPGQNLAGQQTPVNTNSLQQLRTVLNKLKPSSPVWNNQQSLINSEATYVPTKMQIQISAIPVVTRNDISNNFSLAKYATGELLRGTKRSGGGIW